MEIESFDNFWWQKFNLSHLIPPYVDSHISRNCTNFNYWDQGKRKKNYSLISFIGNSAINYSSKLKKSLAVQKRVMTQFNIVLSFERAFHFGWTN
jgi:hypothetical protein